MHPILLVLACAGGGTDSADPGVDSGDSGTPETAACTVTGASDWPSLPNRNAHWVYTYAADGRMLTSEVHADADDTVYDFTWTYDGVCAVREDRAWSRGGAWLGAYAADTSCDAHDNPAASDAITTYADGSTAWVDTTWTYTYDGARKLTERREEEYEGGLDAVDYAYTYVDGRLSTTYVTDYHEIAGEIEYHWDDDGHLALMIAWAYDSAYRYTYDAAGRVVTAELDTPIDGTFDEASTYTYEGDEPYWTDRVSTDGHTEHQDVECR